MSITDGYAQASGFLKLPRVVQEALSKDYKAWVFFTKPQKSDLYVPYNQRSLERRAKVGIHNPTVFDRRVDPDFRAEVEALGANIRVESRWFNAVSVEASGNTLLNISLLPYVLRVELVEGAKPVRPLKTRRTPEDPTPLFGFTFNGGEWSLDYGRSKEQLEQIHVPELHDAGFSGKGVTICMMDAGFNWNHLAFHRLKISGQWDFVMNDGNVRRNKQDPQDYDDEHGTMTLSVAGGYAPGKVIGPAFGANYLLAKTEDGRSETPIEEDFWVAGLEWCEAAGADIISSSLGYRDFDNPASSHSYKDLDGRSTRPAIAANFATNLGILVITSVGNSGLDGVGSLSTPADSEGVLAVGAVHQDGGLAYFSSQGPTADGRIKPELVARGVRVSLALDEEYGRADGTSFAAPLVAGSAALILEANPQWKPEEVKQALLNTADNKESPNNRLGYGIPNILSALSHVPILEQDAIATR